jgi:hypothetical protein
VFVAEDNSKLLISPSVYNMLIKSGHKLKVKKTIKYAYNYKSLFTQGTQFQS